VYSKALPTLIIFHMKQEKNTFLEKAYWDNFYKTCDIDVPSQFCVTMATDQHNRKTIVEFGMGNGRDALYLASQGHIVIAADISESAVEFCDQTMIRRGVSHAAFIVGDISNGSVIENTIKLARERCHKDSTELVFYSRFVMHSLHQIRNYEKNKITSK